jgi:hypothetical protein
MPSSRVVDVVRRHHPDADAAGQHEQRVVAGVVEGLVVVGQLDRDVVAPEHLDQRAQLRLRRIRTACRERSRYGALATAGERHPVPAMCRRQLGQVVDRAALSPAHLGGGDGAGQPPVPVGVAGQDQQVAALGVGDPVLALGQPEAQLGAEDGPDPGPSGGLGEADHPVHAVVVGERQCLDPSPGRLGDQRIRVGGSVEEAVRGVAVQLGPGRCAISPGGLGRSRIHRYLLRSLRKPADSRVRAVIRLVRGRQGGSGTPGQAALELLPRDRGVVPAHGRLRCLAQQGGSWTGPTGSGSTV